jgi:probable addiction module antidote protein
VEILLAGGDKNTRVRDIKTVLRPARTIQECIIARTTTNKYDATEHLRTPEEMAAYLEASFEKAQGDAAFIAKALGDIARAKGMSQVARDASLSRESLYKALSGARSPSLDTIPQSIARTWFKIACRVSSGQYLNRLVRHMDITRGKWYFGIMDRMHTAKHRMTSRRHDDFVPGTPEKRILLVWPLTQEIASLSMKHGVERRLQRHATRLDRREG